MSKGKGPRNRLRGPELKKYGESKLWKQGVDMGSGEDVTVLTMTCPDCGHRHSEVIPKEIEK